MSTVSTVLLALVFPIAWGLASAWAFDRLRARRECETSSDQASGEIPSE